MTGAPDTPGMQVARMPPERFTGTPWRARVVSLALAGMDFLVTVAAYALAVWIYNRSFLEGFRLRAPIDPTHFLLMGLAMSAFLVLALGALGIYTRGVSILNVEEDVMLIKGLLIHAAGALGIAFLLRDFTLPRLGVLFAIVLMLPFVVYGRRLVRRVAQWFLEAGVGTQPVAIYGTGETGRSLAARILQNPQMGLRPVGFLYDRDDGSVEGEIRFGPGLASHLPVLGGLDELKTLPADHVQLLFVALPTLGSERLLEIQDACRSLGIACHHVPLFSSGHFRRMQLTFIGDIPILTERAMRTTIVYRTAKRAVDVGVAGLLVVGLSPVFLLIALLIKLTSRGPVFFTQERIGQHGRAFPMHKFRTMRTEAPSYATKPTAGDPNIFPLGRVLRQSSLDELPQLVNVLKGEMSLVGPRPDMPQIVAAYTPIQRERLLVPPGMTGLWQVSEDRQFPIHENIDYDLYYVYNRSFLLDFAILVRTVFRLGGGH